MLSMDFLTRPVAGLEFIDFQNTNFYERLCGVIKEHMIEEEGVPVLQDTVGDSLAEIIAIFTGFKNIKFNFLDQGNLWVDTGYFSPGHVLNNRGIENFLKPSNTTIYRWFTENKDKVFKGGIDYSTGQVTGSFCTIPVELGINVNVTSYFPLAKIAKWGVPIEGMLAGAITHELGHIFSSCVALLTTLTDNIVAAAALQAFKGASKPEDRVVVLKDSATLLGMKPAKSDELLSFAKSDSEEVFMLYFTKLVTQRNNQRALSVGVTHMTAEVLADMYAIRMGCHKGIIAAVGSLVDRGAVVTFFENFMASCIAALFGMYLAYIPAMITGSFMAIPVVGIISFTVAFIVSFYSRGYSDVYNADHRRIEDAMRQLIAMLKNNKAMPSGEKNDLINQITKLVDDIKRVAPWYEGTVLYRLMGWVFSGGDFKLKEIEHYTQALNNNEITVLAEQIKGV